MKLKSLIDRVANESQETEHDEIVKEQKPKDTNADLGSSDASNEDVKKEPVTTAKSTDDDGDTVEDQLADAIKKEGKDITAVEVGNESADETTDTTGEGDDFLEGDNAENPDSVTEVASNTQSQDEDVDQQEPEAPGPDVDVPEDNNLQVPPETSVEEDSVVDPEPTEEQAQAEEEAETEQPGLEAVLKDITPANESNDPFESMRALFAKFGQDLQTALAPKQQEAALESFEDGTAAQAPDDRDVLDFNKHANAAFTALRLMLNALSDRSDREETQAAVESFAQVIAAHGQNPGVAQAVRLGLSALDRELNVNDIFPAQEDFDDNAEVAQSTAVDQLQSVSDKVEESVDEAATNVVTTTFNVLTAAVKQARGQLADLDTLTARLKATKNEPKPSISVRGCVTRAYLDQLTSVNNYKRFNTFVTHMAGYLRQVLSTVTKLKEGQDAYFESKELPTFVATLKDVVAAFPSIDAELEVERDYAPGIKDLVVKRFFGNGGLTHAVRNIDPEAKGIEYINQVGVFLPVATDCTSLYFDSPSEDVAQNETTQGTLSREDIGEALTALKGVQKAIASINEGENGEELLTQIREAVLSVVNATAPDDIVESFDSRIFIADLATNLLEEFAAFIGFSANTAYFVTRAVDAFIGSAELNACEVAENEISKPKEDVADEVVDETTTEEANAEETAEADAEEEAAEASEEAAEETAAADIAGDEGETTDESNA